MSQNQSSAMTAADGNKIWAIRFLLFIAGLGGLLYGIDVGIIAGALPYLQATTGLTASQLSWHRGGRVAGQRDLDALRRAARRSVGPQGTHGGERPAVRRQHPDDRPGQRLRAAAGWAGCCKASARD